MKSRPGGVKERLKNWERRLPVILAYMCDGSGNDYGYSVRMRVR